MLKIEFEGELKEVKANIPLTQIAELIRRDIENNLQSGLTAQGGGVAALRPSTVRQKGHSRVFFRTGKLIRSVKKTRISQNEFEVSIAEPRTSVASWLHFGTARMVSRPFFGIGNKVLEQIDKALTKTEITFG